MWARVVEIMLGLWLLMSLFIFRDGTGRLALLSNDLLCGSAVIIFGSLSFWRKTSWAHFLTLIVALWLIGYGYFPGYPAPPTAQNRIITGILLAMFAIIPNRIDQIPKSWREFYSGKEG